MKGIKEYGLMRMLSILGTTVPFNRATLEVGRHGLMKKKDHG
jgi:hypothetical protein